jgi:RNA polymerase sigma-70 factor (ECF subfamily)
LLQENYLKVLGYFLKITQNTELAKDLTQETMVKAIKSFQQYRGEAAFSSWLIAIGANLYRDQLRRRKLFEKRYGALIEREPQEYSPNLPGGMTVDLKPALLRLPVEKRFPLILKYYYDYSYQEIASTLKIPIGTVRSRLFSGLRQLQEMLKEKLPAEECKE